jgi:hypothetical protein
MHDASHFPPCELITDWLTQSNLSVWCCFPQFTDAVLPAVMFMLDKTRLDYTARSNPVKVVRSVAAMVSSWEETKNERNNTDWREEAKSTG